MNAPVSPLAVIEIVTGWVSHYGSGEERRESFFV